MPRKGWKSSDKTRKRISEHHWTKKTDEEKAATLERLREARANQAHPLLLARGFTAEQIAEAKSQGLRWCSGTCKAFIPLDRFGVYQKTGKPLMWCRECYANYMRLQRADWGEEKRARISREGVLRKFGVTPEWYDAKLVEQGGKCALCDAKSGARDSAYLCVDHNHTTNAVRGLLCTKCNASIERLETIPNWALRAIAYLQKY